MFCHMVAGEFQEILQHGKLMDSSKISPVLRDRDGGGSKRKTERERKRGTREGETHTERKKFPLHTCIVIIV